VLGKAALLVFAEDHLAAGDDVEDSPGCFDEPGLDADFLFDFGRQTGGLRQIVSLSAIGDRDFHEHADSECRLVNERRLRGDGRDTLTSDYNSSIPAIANMARLAIGGDRARGSPRGPVMARWRR
jgi:hypothetical protein